MTNWILHQHPDVVWSIVLALTGLMLWAMRKYIAPAITTARIQRAHNADVMRRIDVIASQFTPNSASSLVDRLARIESMLIAAAGDAAYLQASVDFLFGQGRHTIWRSDPSGLVTYASEEFETLTGLEPRRLMGNNWEQIIHQDDLQRVRDEWSRAVTQRIDFSLKYRMCDASGTPIWVHAKARPIYSGGAVTGYLGSVRRCCDPQR